MPAPISTAATQWSRRFDSHALISARGIGVSRNGRELLLDVNLDIREREIVTLIGPNGAGKTTLVRVLLGLEKPDRGTVASAPRPAHRLRPAALRQRCRHPDDG